jgi:hypothetical protein
MSDEAWQPGYDTLKKQMEAIQSRADVYKRRSPLEASTHIDNIAKSLAKDYGITSIGDIGVRYETRPAYVSGSDESATVIPEEQLPIYYNKNNPSQIIPGYKFASEGRGDGYSNYNLQPVQQADGSTIVVPIQQYSKSGMGAFVEDLGPIIQVASLVAMAAGAPPLYLAAGNLALQGAAGNINDFNDALRVAAPYLIPAGLQGLDVVGPSTASTLAGRVAENYSGFTGIGADILGGGLSGAVKAGLTGGDIGVGALIGGATPGLTSGLKDAYKGLTGFNYGADLDDMGGSALEGFGPTTTDTNAGVINLAGAGANNIFGNLTDDDLNDLYGSTVLNRTDALTDRVANPVTGIVNSGSNNIFGNLTDDELNDLYASTVSNTGAATSNLSVDTMAGAGSDKTVSDLYDMDARLGNTGDTIYTDKTGDSYYVDDNGDVQSLTKGQADTLLTTDIVGNTGLKTGDAGSGKTVDDLYSMDARQGATGDTIYTDKTGGSYYVDDNGDVQSLTKGQADTLLTTVTAGDAGLKLDKVEVNAKHDDTDLDYPWVEDTTKLTTTPTLDLSTLTTLTQFGPFNVTTGDKVALDTKDTKALTTSNLTTIDTKDTGALTSSQIALLTTVGTGLLVSDIIGGKDTKNITTLTTGLTALDTKNITTLDTKNITTLTTGVTALDTKNITALTTMDALGLKGIEDPANRYWQQTGKAGTGGQGGVRFFDWTTNPVPAMGGSNLAAAQALSSVPMLTQAQIAALQPTPKQYFNAATNRYYTDPTGQATPPAGFVQKTFKDGGEVETKHFNGGGFSFADFDLGIEPYNFADFDLGINFSGPDFNGINFDELIPAGTGYLDDGAATLNDLRWESGYFGTPEEVAQNYSNEGKAYPDTESTKNSPINAISGDAKTVIDKIKGLGAKLGEKALQSILDNPGAWMAALAGAGLGYAASKNNTVSPMGLQGLGMTQQQVYNTLKGGNYVGKAVGGEIPGYGAGGGLHYLKSAEDGMADKIPATIDNKQPARLSGGEFVIPADVVSHLGNGNSEAGAKHLYEMMDRIRQARTGTPKQGKQINPAKFTPK